MFSYKFGFLFIWENYWDVTDYQKWDRYPVNNLSKPLNKQNKNDCNFGTETANFELTILSI